MKQMFCRPTDERALIAYAMSHIDYYLSITSKLSSKDFLYDQHEMIMLIFETLAAKGAEKFDSELIISEAQAQGVLSNVGGLKYIQSINNLEVSPTNFEVYMKAVFEASWKYGLYKVLKDGVQDVADNAKKGKESIDLMTGIEAQLMALSSEEKGSDGPRNLADGLKELIEKRKDTQIEFSGIPTGYPILDKQIDGMIPGTLMVVAARKKRGKSTFLSNISLRVAMQQNLPVLYIDTELSFDEWRDRALATVSKVEEREIKHGGYSDETYHKLLEAERILSNAKIYHEYMPGYSVDKLVSLYRKFKLKENIGLMVFDYLKEPDSSSIDRQRKEYQVLGDVTTKLKDLAGRLNIPALTAVQLNRDHDVADSDRIARYADIICLWRNRTKEEIDEGGYDAGTHRLVIKDTRRGGSTGEHGIGYKFFKKKLYIREVPADQQYFFNFEEIVDEGDASKYGDDVGKQEL
jgi:replicative DNA helicase